jgi:uncharacterized ubiquitin-like protein YukD
MTRSIVYIIVIAAVFLLGIFATKWWSGFGAHQSKEDVQVLVEKMKNVSKLITVEGYFSEVYEYKDFMAYDISLFRKKALIRVKAKVSAGVDLNNMKIDVQPMTKTIKISNFSNKAQILSIDHDLDYYDISEGTFNSFSTEDYNLMNEKAKNYIKEQAEKSELLQNASKQTNQILEVLKTMGQTAGYKVEIDTTEQKIKN